MERDPRIDAKLKGLPESAQEELWAMRYPGEDGERMSMAAIQAEIPLRHGFPVSLGVVSEFFKWMRLKKRVEAATQRAEQARYALAQDPNMTPADLSRVGQMVFTAETIEDGNVKAYVELVKLQLQAAKQEMEMRKLKVMEAKAAQADAAKNVLRENLSPEEEKRRLREILA
jgi:hypothetical protein